MRPGQLLILNFNSEHLLANWVWKHSFAACEKLLKFSNKKTERRLEHAQGLQ